MTGYSHRTLVEKLGYQSGDTIYLVGAPDWFKQELKENSVTMLPQLPATWAHLFVENHDKLVGLLSSINREQVTKGIWVSWPKKSSGVATDLTEQTFRDEILPLGWVDVKVCAVDDTWSGLKFLRRKN